jgi:hypothetical protein
MPDAYKKKVGNPGYMAESYSFLAEKSRPLSKDFDKASIFKTRKKPVEEELAKKKPQPSLDDSGASSAGFVNAAEFRIGLIASKETTVRSADPYEESAKAKANAKAKNKGKGETKVVVDAMSSKESGSLNNVGGLVLSQSESDDDESDEEDLPAETKRGLERKPPTTRESKNKSKKFGGGNKDTPGGETDKGYSSRRNKAKSSSKDKKDDDPDEEGLLDDS